MMRAAAVAAVVLCGELSSSDFVKAESYGGESASFIRDDSTAASNIWDTQIKSGHMGHFVIDRQIVNEPDYKRPFWPKRHIIFVLDCWTGNAESVMPIFSREKRESYRRVYVPSVPFESLQFWTGIKNAVTAFDISMMGPDVGCRCAPSVFQYYPYVKMQSLISVFNSEIGDQLKLLDSNPGPLIISHDQIGTAGLTVREICHPRGPDSGFSSIASLDEGVADVPNANSSNDKSARSSYGHPQRPFGHLPLGYKVGFGAFMFVCGLYYFTNAFRRVGIREETSILYLVGGVGGIVVGIAFIFGAIG